MHFMLLIRTVPFIRAGLSYLGFLFSSKVRFSLSEAVNTLLWEGLLSNSCKRIENGSFFVAS